MRLAAQFPWIVVAEGETLHIYTLSLLPKLAAKQLLPYKRLKKAHKIKSIALLEGGEISYTDGIHFYIEDLVKGKVHQKVTHPQGISFTSLAYASNPKRLLASDVNHQLFLYKKKGARWQPQKTLPLCQKIHPHGLYSVHPTYLVGVGDRMAWIWTLSFGNKDAFTLTPRGRIPLVKFFLGIYS